MYTTSQPVLERDQNYRARNESVSVRGHDPSSTGAPELSLPGPRGLPRGTLCRSLSYQPPQQRPMSPLCWTYSDIQAILPYGTHACAHSKLADEIERRRAIRRPGAACAKSRRYAPSKPPRGVGPSDLCWPLGSRSCSANEEIGQC